MRLERLNQVKNVLFTLQRDTLADVKSLLAGLPGAAAYTAAANFRAIAAPTFQDALNLFNNADFKKLIASYAAAKDLAQNFVDYTTTTYAPFRATSLNLGKFGVFKQYLEGTFDFAAFKASYIANLAAATGSDFPIQRSGH